MRPLPIAPPNGKETAEREEAGKGLPGPVNSAAEFVNGLTNSAAGAACASRGSPPASRPSKIKINEVNRLNSKKGKSEVFSLCMAPILLLPCITPQRGRMSSAKDEGGRHVQK
jgi:hypothetical protein